MELEWEVENMSIDKDKKDESYALSIKSHKIIGEISNDHHTNNAVITLNV